MKDDSATGSELYNLHYRGEVVKRGKDMGARSNICAVRDSIGVEVEAAAGHLVTEGKHPQLLNVEGDPPTSLAVNGRGRVTQMRQVVKKWGAGIQGEGVVDGVTERNLGSKVSGGCQGKKHGGNAGSE